MGCSAGLIAIDLAKQLLQVRWYYLFFIIFKFFFLFFRIFMSSFVLANIFFIIG
jgi:hypothetical protein